MSLHVVLLLTWCPEKIFSPLFRFICSCRDMPLACLTEYHQNRLNTLLDELALTTLAATILFLTDGG